jgi:hypothetical protein
MSHNHHIDAVRRGPRCCAVVATPSPPAAGSVLRAGILRTEKVQGKSQISHVVGSAEPSDRMVEACSSPADSIGGTLGSTIGRARRDKVATTHRARDALPPLLRAMALPAVLTALLAIGLLRATPAPATVLHSSALHATSPAGRHGALPIRHHRLTKQHFKKRFAALAPSPPRHTELLPTGSALALRIGDLGTQARWRDRARAPPRPNHPG